MRFGCSDYNNKITAKVFVLKQNTVDNRAAEF